MENQNEYYQDLNLREEFCNISMVTPDYKYLFQVFGTQNDIVIYDLDQRIQLYNKF
jgi:hypothetical protein